MQTVQDPCVVLEPIESDDTTIRIYALAPDQQFPISEIEPTRHFPGPAIVVERERDGVVNTSRYTLDDEHIWDLIQSWVFRMVRAEELIQTNESETYEGLRKMLDPYRL